MRPIKKTISLDEAKALIAAAVSPIDRTETISIDAADGRVLAEAIVSGTDVPPFSRAAMDGYAVRAADTTGAGRGTPRRLMRVATVFTGQVAERAVGPGECIEIATGAPMPTGADAVVIVEDTQDDPSGRIDVFSSVIPGQNIGPQGADIRRGQQVLAIGDLLTPSRIGAIAALGKGHLTVFARPRVAILSTGNEIIDVGQPLGPGQIYDINRHTIAAVVAAHGGIPKVHRTAADTLDDLSRAVDDCLEDDVLVFSGGSSVGERDLILDVLAARGELIFHGIALKPGKPTAFGRVEGRLFFGMPGYPTSCLSNAYLLLVPALRTFARLPTHLVRTITVPLKRRVTSVPGRHQLYTVRIMDGMAEPAFKASGDITSMSQADGYIEIPTDVEAVEAGTSVDVTLF